MTAVHVGTLGLVMEPVGAAIERLVLTDVPADALVLLDPNCRPGAVADHEAYRRRIGVIARRADIVKASTEDLAYLYPGVPAEEAARALLAVGPSLVLVTDGPRPARAFLPGAVLAEEVPRVVVVDTIGAGDAFGGGFLAWWTAHGLGRADLERRGDAGDALVGKALRAAAAVAALTCARAGADPPALAELQPQSWWPTEPNALSGRQERARKRIWRTRRSAFGVRLRGGPTRSRGRRRHRHGGLTREDDVVVDGVEPVPHLLMGRFAASRVPEQVAGVLRPDHDRAAV